MKMQGGLAMLVRMNRYLCLWLLAVVLPLLSACSTVVVEPAPGQQADAMPEPARARTPVPGGSYMVVKGDTMYSIAFRNGVDFRDLAKWNGIAAPYTIWPGQRLRLSPPRDNRPVAPTVATIGSAASKASSPAAATVSAAPVFENVSAATPAPAPAMSTHVAQTASAAVTVAQHPAPTLAPAPSVSTTVPVAGESRAVAPSAVPAPAPVATGGSSRTAGGVTWRWPADGQLVKRFTPGDAVPGIEIAGKAGEPVRAAADGVVVYSGNGLVGYGELVIIKHSDSLLSAYGHNSKRLVTEGQRVTAGQVIAQMGSSGASRVELGFQIRKDGNPVDPLDYLPAK
ncbi:MAG: peptidoglycan DD-metalloendopeptidase family protein [Rhodanobacter sp.]